MLTKAQEKRIRKLHSKKGRAEEGSCLVEGRKNVEAIPEQYLQLRFTPEDTTEFDNLVTTQTPQEVAAIAQIPEWTFSDIEAAPTIVIADGVQDPGNMGSILRLCQGFSASLIAVESADISQPKVVRSSAGAFFGMPWMKMKRQEAEQYCANNQYRALFRLELGEDQAPLVAMNDVDRCIIIIGSEGNGIYMKTAGTSIRIAHEEALESLNVAHALAIALHSRYTAS